MSDSLAGLLLNYIRENNSQLLHQLEQDDALQAWVYDKIQEVELVLTQSKPGPFTDASFMSVFKRDLAPNRFRYVRDLFETEFTNDYQRMMEAGTLHYELVNLVSACHPLFEETPLIDGFENPQLDYAVANLIRDYLETQSL